jgi:hypothetical protein
MILKIDLVICYPILPFLFPSINNIIIEGLTHSSVNKSWDIYISSKTWGVKEERKLNQAYLPPHVSTSFAQQGLHKHVSMF